MQKEYITNSPDQTLKVAEKVAALVKNGGIICLYGDLGSGKTTFTQSLAKILGIEKHLVSPSFLVVRTYVLPDRKFYHADLYRLDSEDAIREIGLVDLMNDKSNIVAIEWSEKLGNLLPMQRIEVHMEYLDENIRKIKVRTSL